MKKSKFWFSMQYFLPLSILVVILATNLLTHFELFSKWFKVGAIKIEITKQYSEGIKSKNSGLNTPFSLGQNNEDDNLSQIENNLKDVVLQPTISKWVKRKNWTKVTELSALANSWLDEYWLAMAFFKNGEYTTALKHFEISLNANKTSSSYQVKSMYLIGRSYLENNNLDSSKLYLKKTIELDSNHYHAHFWMGFASENESVDLSKSYYKRAIELNLSAKSALSWARLGRLYLQENSLDSGAVYLKKAIRLSPALEEARADQVRLRLLQNDSVEVKKELQKLKAIRPKDPYSIWLGVMYYWRQFEWEKAFVELELWEKLMKNKDALEWKSYGDDFKVIKQIKSSSFNLLKPQKKNAATIVTTEEMPSWSDLVLENFDPQKIYLLAWQQLENQAKKSTELKRADLYASWGQKTHSLAKQRKAIALLEAQQDSVNAYATLREVPFAELEKPHTNEWVDANLKFDQCDAVVKEFSNSTKMADRVFWSHGLACNKKWKEAYEVLCPLLKSKGWDEDFSEGWLQCGTWAMQIGADESSASFNQEAKEIFRTLLQNQPDYSEARIKLLSLFQLEGQQDSVEFYQKILGASK